MTRLVVVTRREMIFLCTGIAGVLFGLAIFYWSLINYDGRRDIDLEGFVEPPGTLLPGGRMATEDLCTDMLPCTQAVDSDSMTLRRFDSAPQTSAGAAMLGGDVRVAGWILVEFKPGALSDDEKSNFLSTLYCIHVSSDPC